MSAREKYPDFVIFRTFRRLAKRATDPNADHDGMREYSHLQCPHCDKNDIEILSDNIKYCKTTVVQDHLRICPDYTGERPTKRGSKATGLTTTLTSYQCTNPNHTILAEDVERLKEESQQHKEEIRQNKEETRQLFYHLAKHLQMQFDPPVDPPCLIEEVGVRERERLMLKESAGSSSAIIPSTTLNQFQQDQDMFNTMLTQKDSVISDQKLMMEQHEAAHRREMEQNEMFLREKTERIATLERERDQYARIVRQKQEEIDRIKAEKSTMEGNLRAQIKRQKCGSSSSLLAQAQQNHKEHYKRSRSPSPR